jgi:hypothetical protein
MLKTGQDRVNALRARYWRNLAHAAPASGTRRAENRWTRSTIQPPKAVPAPLLAPPEQTCFGCARCAATIHLEFQPRETRRRAATHERFPRRRASALLAISNDATPKRRSLLKMSFLERATRMHRPATPLRLSFGFAGQSPARMRDCTRGSSRAPRVSATLPSPRPAPRQFLEHARPIPHRTKSMEELAFASSCASTTKRKTSSRTDSKKHVQSAAQEKMLPHSFEGGAGFQSLIIAGLCKL